MVLFNKSKHAEASGFCDQHCQPSCRDSNTQDNANCKDNHRPPHLADGHSWAASLGPAPAGGLVANTHICARDSDTYAYVQPNRSAPCSLSLGPRVFSPFRTQSLAAQSTTCFAGHSTRATTPLPPRCRWFGADCCAPVCVAFSFRRSMSCFLRRTALSTSDLPALRVWFLRVRPSVPSRLTGPGATAAPQEPSSPFFTAAAQPQDDQRARPKRTACSPPAWKSRGGHRSSL